MPGKRNPNTAMIVLLHILGDVAGHRGEQRTESANAIGTHDSVGRLALQDAQVIFQPSLDRIVERKLQRSRRLGGIWVWVWARATARHVTSSPNVRVKHDS